VHDPEFAPSLDIICKETLPALAKARDEGKVKWVGVTGRYSMLTLVTHFIATNMHLLLRHTHTLHAYTCTFVSTNRQRSPRKYALRDSAGLVGSSRCQSLITCVWVLA